MKLNKKKCQACSGKTPKLDQDGIINYLKELKNWSVNDEQQMIYKKFNFKTFKQALDFTNKVGVLADIESHHPDISLGWGYVLVMLHTHAIQGLSINDFILAAKIDNL